MRLPPLVVVGILVVAAMGGVYIYYQANFDLGGLLRPDFQNFTYDANYSQIQSADGSRWTISFEKPTDSVFSGLVRYVSPIREDLFPFMTHDILVTTGDYANPDIVNTNVFNHHFIWSSRQTNSPKGTIHLLHILPMNEEIYQKLLGVANGQTITVRGHEILRIDAYTPDGKSNGYWQDSGCNSMVAWTLQIQKE